MLKRKSIKEKGKISFSRFFQSFKPGDIVSLVRDLSFKANFPQRVQGRTGVVKEQRGRAFLVEINELGMRKSYVINPIHLKKLSPSQ